MFDNALCTSYGSVYTNKIIGGIYGTKRCNEEPTGEQVLQV